MLDGVWDDGEWTSWGEISAQIEYKEWRVRYPNADLSLVPIFESLIEAAQSYYLLTGLHLQVYGDIGELYGAITHGIKLHRNYAQGSDGRLGDHFVEIKTITPFKRNDVVEVNLERNFSKLLLVKIDDEFQVRAKLVDRKLLPKPTGKKLRLNWQDVLAQ